MDTFGLIPVLVVKGHFYWQLLTYQFLHGGLFHWLFNMFILWTVGGMLENQWGSGFFLRFCLVTSIGSALCVIAFAPHSYIPVIGLSGTLFALLVAFAMLYPDSVMYLYFLIPVKAWQAAALFAFIEFFAAIEGRNAALTSIAHLGGMLFGYLYVKFGSEIERHGSRFVDHFGSLAAFKRKKTGVTLHEVTNDLVSEVDRILDKVSRQGSDSLTPKEKEIMNRYTKMRH